MTTAPRSTDTVYLERDQGADWSTTVIDVLRQTLNRVLCGKPEVVELVLTGLLAKGHLLIEDLPGLGKTTLAKAIARAIGGEFARVQCTPDLLPTDITGFSMFNQATRQFEFQQGPVFADVLLADEINRATPRTQSALFEAMAEWQVTIDRKTHALPAAFFVIATQNPVESHGAYPLPEGQLDRFALKLTIGYPSGQDEMRMLAEAIDRGDTDRGKVEPVLSLAELQQLQRSVAAVEVAENVRRYLVELASFTRGHPAIHLGVSPRGVLTWQRLSQAHAYLRGRTFVMPDDVQAMAQPGLSVRLVGDFDQVESFIEELLASVETP